MAGKNDNFDALMAMMALKHIIWRQGACGLHDIRHKGHFPML